MLWLASTESQYGANTFFWLYFQLFVALLRTKKLKIKPEILAPYRVLTRYQSQHMSVM